MQDSTRAKLKSCRGLFRSATTMSCTPWARRLISFRLGPIGLAFTGASGAETRSRLDELERQYGSDWVSQWLLERSVSREWIEFCARQKGAKYEETLMAG